MYSQVLGTTLILTWIPNNHLKKNPRSIENSPAHPKISPRRSPRPEFSQTDWSPSSSQCGSVATTPSSECAEKLTQSCKVSTDVISISSEGSSDQASEGNSKLDISGKSQSDSGIGEEGFTPGTEKTKDSKHGHLQDLSQQNNSLSTQISSSNQKQLNIGQHVNDLHYKDTNVKKINMDGFQTEHVNDTNGGCHLMSQPTTSYNATPAIDCDDIRADSSLSSDSDELTTQTQLTVLLHKPQASTSGALSQKDRIKERMSSGSTKSVASIEMDGDKLVIVTEEMGNDSAFVENGISNVCGDAKDDDVDGITSSKSIGEVSEMADKCSAKEQSPLEEGSSESSFPSPGGGKYREMLAELQEQTQDKLRDGMEKNILGKTKNFDIDKLKDSLDLKLDLTNSHSATSNGDTFTMETPDIQIDPGAMDSDDNIVEHDDDDSSSTTSGPDSAPPSPITPIEYDSNTPGTPSSSMSGSATHNLMFPDNSVSYSNSPGFGIDVSNKSAKDQVCGVFSVDLGNCML